MHQNFFIIIQSRHIYPIKGIHMHEDSILKFYASKTHH